MSTSEEFKSKKIRSSNIKSYNMYNKYRGIALIFNHLKFEESLKLEERIGTEADVSALKRDLTILGFTSDSIIVENDLTKDQILNYWNESTRRKYIEILENCDCIAVFVLSHGSNDNKLYAANDTYGLYDLIKIYTVENFKELAGKPKLFFINACRGKEPDTPIYYRHADSNTQVQNVQDNTAFYQSDVSNSIDDDLAIVQDTSFLSKYADILIGRSSHHDQSSFRNEAGSWYIQDLCSSIRKFQNDLNTVDITHILLYANFLITEREAVIAGYNGRKQISNYSSALRRKLYFTKK